MNDFLVENLTQSVGDQTVFKNISFIIHDLDRIGIIGVNGSGKTTLLDVLSGRLGFSGDRSPFSRKKDYQIAYLTQEADFAEDKTVLETVLSDDLPEIALIREYELLMSDYTKADPQRLERLMAEMDALSAWTVESEVKAVLSRLGIHNLTQKVKTLSGGMRRRVQLAQVLLADADLFLLDEPTNHLDIETIAWLADFLKSRKKTLMFVTHDRYFLDSLSTRIFELAHAELTEYQGNYQDYLRLKAEKDERQAAYLHKQKQLYKQELSWMRTQPQARSTKQEARIKRFGALEKELAQSQPQKQLEFHFEASRIGKKVLEFTEVDLKYDTDYLFCNFSLLLQNKDRIGIVGPNGVGKTSLLNMISGDLAPSGGSIDIGETVRVGYFSQQIRGMDENKRLIAYLQEKAEAVRTSSGLISVTELLEQFLFPPESHGKLISKLSGGEKKRLYLLQILLEKPNLLLLDEPTNDLDIETLTVLEKFLEDFSGPVIAVSHDRYFLDRVCNKILAFENGQISQFLGNYSDYLAEKNREKSSHFEPSAAEAPLASVKDKPRKTRLSYFEQQEWNRIEADIEQLESAIEDITALMQDNASDYEKLAELQNQLDEKNAELLQKYERYDYLSDKQNEK
ncbi:ABC-F family ATP-binding cassette domain-containing protein [Streptococcus sp. H31]|uniref:ABC-F family ATP-binding cassette domain-containing protein n=1 Tax=Streptococcus huangxiaojuni TaxID=3237239 RepID=UPI0034A3C9DE